MGDVGVDSLQCTNVERREVGGGDRAVLFPDVLKVVKVASGALAHEVAFAPFPAGGGRGAGSVWCGREVGGV